MDARRSQSFVQQAAVLAAAGLAARFIGFLYRLPLTGLIGDAGNAVYSAGYYVYIFFFVLSSAGLPAAIAKMVSERFALKQYVNAHRVFEISLIAAAAMGFICALALWFGARPLARLVGVPESYAALRSLSPTVLIVAVISVYRGYFQGMGNSVPTAASQLIDQAMNAVFSVLMAWILLRATGDIAMGAAGGTIGTGIGALAGLAVMMYVYRMSKPGIHTRLFADKKTKLHESDEMILVTLLKTAFPIIIGTAVFSFTNLIDLRMVMDRLVNGAKLDYETARGLYGQLSGKYVLLTTLPAAVSTAMATAAIPNIAASVAMSERKNVLKKINTSLRLAMVVSIPAAVGIGVLGNQIVSLLFKSHPDGGDLLIVGAVSIIFLALAQITTGMLQAVGRVEIPAIAAVAGALVKIPLNYILIGVAGINVKGAVISTIVCYVVASTIDLAALRLITNVRLDFSHFFVKPAICSLLMGMVCYVVYYALFYASGNNAFCTVTAILAGLLSYLGFMLYMKGFNKNDLILVPMGEQIVRTLVKLRML